MQKKWLNYLIDPKNKKSLELKINKSKNGDVIEGCLVSSNGLQKYPIINGIPRFVPREFYIGSGLSRSDVVQTGRSFGDKWREKTSWKLGQRKAEIKMLKEQFLAMLGIKKKKELDKLFKDGINCLNAGCGVAWSEYLFNVNKKTNRFAIDLSLSVEVAHQRTKNMPNVFVAQADLFQLPFKKKFFDIIFSDGVLHHTGNAKKAFDSLSKYLKPGGFLGIYVYCKKPFLRELADREIRKITTAMTYNKCLEFSSQVTELGKSLKRFKKPLIVKSDIPLLGIKKGKYNLQKFIYDHFLKCFYNKNLGHNLSNLTNVDWYHPKYASHHSRKEIKGWFKKNNFSQIKFIQPKGWEYSGYFVSGRKLK